MEEIRGIVTAGGDERGDVRERERLVIELGCIDCLGKPDRDKFCDCPLIVARDVAQPAALFIRGLRLRALYAGTLSSSASHGDPPFVYRNASARGRDAPRALGRRAATSKHSVSPLHLPRTRRGLSPSTCAKTAGGPVDLPS